MQPWIELGRAKAPDGSELVLRRRGEDFVIRVGGIDLMSSRMHHSEDQLAWLGCAALASAPRARVLVGGLGMGFTTRAALSVLAPDAEVVVAELLPEVVAWNRGPLAEVAGRPLDDRRVQVVERDVVDVIAGSPSSFDAILLDVDNGPEALASTGNARLYSPRGLARIAQALRPAGVLAVWSVAGDERFTAKLARAGFDAKTERVRERPNGGAIHCIWIARVRRGAR